MMLRSCLLFGLLVLLVIGGSIGQDPPPEAGADPDATTTEPEESTTGEVGGATGADGTTAAPATDGGTSDSTTAGSDGGTGGSTNATGETSSSDLTTNTPESQTGGTGDSSSGANDTQPGTGEQTTAPAPAAPEASDPNTTDSAGGDALTAAPGGDAETTEAPGDTSPDHADGVTQAGATTAVSDGTTVAAAGGGCSRGDTCEETVTDVAATVGGGITDAAATGETTAKGPQAETTQAGTAGVTKAEEPQTDAPTEPPVTFAPGDPCASPRIEDKPSRRFSVKNEDACDDSLQSGWIHFQLDGKSAEIPTECIKNGYCGVQMGFHLELAGKDLPTLGSEIETDLCGSHALLEVNTACCIDRIPVIVRNCGEFYIYNFTAYNTCPSGICLKLPNEEIPYKFLGNPPPTAQPTTERPADVPRVGSKTMTEKELESVVTVEFEQDGDLTSSQIEEFDKKFRPMIAARLNKLQTTIAPVAGASPVPSTTAAAGAAPDPPAAETTKTGGSLVASQPPATQTDPPISDLDKDAGGPVPPQNVARFRRSADTYTEDDICYVEPTPNKNEYNGRMQAAFYVCPKGGKDAVSQDDLYDATTACNEDDTMKNEVGKSAVAIYKGMPREGGSDDVWETHKGLFITIIVLAIICLILLLIGFLCLKCRGRQPEKTRLAEEGNRDTGGVHSPISDEEIVRPERTVVQHSAPPPSRQRDEDNGWVVPIDQVNGRGQPDMEDTKL